MTEIILHLSYYNYRYFSLYLGIWLKRDVIEENGGYNLYSPCFSSIFNYDELGLLNSTEKRLVRRHPIWTIKVNKAKKIAEEQSRSYPGQWNGSGDAYRHCIWSCEMAKRIGKTNAELFGDAHEETGNGNPKEIEMDKHNNQVGRMLSESACSCADACKQALEEGKLMKFDVDLRRSGEIDPDKDILIPTTPILLPKTTIDDFYNYH